jgi:hypothetical protein
MVVASLLMETLVFEVVNFIKVMALLLRVLIIPPSRCISPARVSRLSF